MCLYGTVSCLVPGTERLTEMKLLNDRLKFWIMTLLMLTLPLAGCVGGSDDSDDEPAPIDIMGCTDDTANNYDPSATSDDGSCTYDTNNGNNGGTDDVMGCMDSDANLSLIHI